MRMERDFVVTDLGNNTWQIQEGIGSAGIHMYLLAGRQKAMLIDTGLWGMDVLGIAQSLTKLPVFVVNTHGHLDHISANHQFEEAYLHPADEAVFAEHSSYEARRAYAEGLLAEQGQPASALDAPEMQDMAQRMMRLPQRENRHPLHDGMVFDLGGRVVRVVETPGHTMGCVCLLDETNRLLFTGDMVCDQGVLLHFPHSAPVPVFKQSIEKLLALEGSYNEMWPGHHRSPLEKEILQRYTACAEQAECGEPGQTIVSAAGAAKMIVHDGIALSVAVDG